MRETVVDQFRDIDAITQPVLLARGTWTAPFLREVVDIIARLRDATVSRRPLRRP